jgi:hypothetical protein
MDQMDKRSLESAIKDEAKLAITDIMRKEAAEILRLDDAYAGELEAFRKKTEAWTDARIRQESSRVENRTGLDLRKLKLKRVETFIHCAVDGAAAGIRDNPRYKSFLLGVIVDAARLIPGGIEIKIKSEDLAWEKEIREVLKAAGVSNDISIVEDKTIKWGGCIIVDVQGGRIFDGSIERIYFRKSVAIRREIMRLLDDQHGKMG